MALAIQITTNATREQRDEVWRELDAVDLHDPKRRQHHVAWGSSGAHEIVAP